MVLREGYYPHLSFDCGWLTPEGCCLMRDRFTIVCADGDEGYFALLGDQLLARLGQAGVRLEWFNGTPEHDQAWLERIGDADGLLLLWAMPDAVLEQAPKLRAVSWVGTGVETFVNVPLASSLGIRVCNTPGYGSNAVAEHALGLMLALARQTVALDAEVRQGRWPRDEVRGLELAGKTVGIVGLGGIGTRMAHLCGALGMRVVAWTRAPAPERLRAAGAAYLPLDELAAAADVVTLHLAATTETVGLVSEAFLRRMRPDALLVNTARGELVDEAALVRALREGWIAGAALDVFSTEPLPADHPWRDLPNVVLTPHVGFRTPEASGRSVRMALENLIDLFEGRPRHVVNERDVRKPRG
jgi:D-3-phosphoglycerate dehydrogenase